MSRHVRASRAACAPRAALAVRALVVRALVAALVAARWDAGSARADLLLNEVLYDPSGADEGLEFVELWNPDSVPLSLDQIVVESGDGSRPDSWTVAYRGDPGDTVAPRSAFLIAASSLLTALQNGPDAVRLSRGALRLDLVGYGDLSASALYEGTPAPDAPSGWSLARRRDGVDTDVNRDDWEGVAAPTPGRANHPDYRLELSRAGFAISPEVGWPGGTLSVAARVRNTGWRTVEATRWTLDVDLSLIPGAWVPASVAPGVPIAPGDSARVECSLSVPAAGPFRVRARVRDLTPGVAALADTVEAPGRSIAGPAVVNEFAFRDAGAGEWVEIWFRGAVQDAGALSLADATGRASRIGRGALPRAVERGSYLVLAEEPDRVRVRFGLPDSVVLPVLGGWPSLNDQGPGEGDADRVRVLLEDGSPCDAVPYRAGASPQGNGVERLSPDLPSADAGSWAESIDPGGGTPGRPNSLRAPDGAAPARGALLAASDRVLRRPGGGTAVPVVLRVTAEARGRRITVRVHDLLGRTVRTLVNGQRFSAEGSFIWDGRDDRGGPVAPGLYVVRAEAAAEDAAPSRATSVPLAVAAERGR